jgi:hypothetical protein
MAPPIATHSAAPTAAAPTAATRAPTPAPETDGFGFGDLIDIINPLHHIPIVNVIYRQLSGDTIGGVARIAGGALFGGVSGLASAVANTVMKEATGKDIAGHAIALAGEIDTSNAFDMADFAEMDSASDRMMLADLYQAPDTVVAQNWNTESGTDIADADETVSANDRLMLADTSVPGARPEIAVAENRALRSDADADAEEKTSADHRLTAGDGPEPRERPATEVAMARPEPATAAITRTRRALPNPAASQLLPPRVLAADPQLVQAVRSGKIPSMQPGKGLTSDAWLKLVSASRGGISGPRSAGGPPSPAAATIAKAMATYGAAQGPGPAALLSPRR